MRDDPELDNILSNNAGEKLAACRLQNMRWALALALGRGFVTLD